MLLRSEHRVIRFLEYVVGCVIAAVIGLAVAAIGMSLGCLRPNTTVVAPPQPAPPEPTADENETYCMREATKRIVDSASCEEAWIRLVNLGVQETRCSSYFKADRGLMTVLVCDNTSSSELDDSTR